MFKRLLIWLGLLKEETPVTVIGKGEPSNPVAPGVVIEKPQWNAPWVFQDLDLLGRKETDPELNRRITPIWKKLGLSYTTLAGNSHAWCQARIEYVLNKVGLKGTGSAGASSLQKYGRECPYWFGTLLPLEHENGNHHADIFLYWIDEAKGIAATMDGNKDNRFDIFATDISGRGDKVVPSPRWPANWPDGQFVSMEEVLRLYPMLKVSGSGGSTR